MLSPRRDQGPSRLSETRDVVEIVAIVLAGAWAFYTFVYNDRIKPLQDPPTVVVDVKLEPAGTRGALRAIKLTRRFHNPGRIEVRFLASAESVFGAHVGAAHEAAREETDSVDIRRAPGIPSAVQRVVWTRGWRYKGSGGTSTQKFSLEPDETDTLESIFYVPGDRYDALSFFGDYAFTKEPNATIPVALDVDARGHFEIRDLPCPPSVPCDSSNVQALTTVSLWR